MTSSEDWKNRCLYKTRMPNATLHLLAFLCFDLLLSCVKMADEVVLLGTWFSVFAMRVRIALAEKGVQYEYKEEDLRNKSELLLKTNPVHEKIPVLFHNGKPVSESLIIVEYIDEVWNDRSPLLPSDPYQRAQAKFWADFVDKNVADSLIRDSKGQGREVARNDFIEALKTLEGELGDKPYFGGENFGFVDVALVGFYSWFFTFETFGKHSISIEAKCPKIVQWAKRCLQRESVAKTLPDEKKVYELSVELRKRLGVL